MPKIISVCIKTKNIIPLVFILTQRYNIISIYVNKIKMWCNWYLISIKYFIKSLSYEELQIIKSKL